MDSLDSMKETVQEDIVAVITTDYARSDATLSLSGEMALYARLIL